MIDNKVSLKNMKKVIRDICLALIYNFRDHCLLYPRGKKKIE